MNLKRSCSAGENRLLFLLRTYNDIDHIVPVIWKAATLRMQPMFLFVDHDYSADYRVKFAVAEGAIHAVCPTIRRYHFRMRRWLFFRGLRRVVDWCVGRCFGDRFLRENQIKVVINEWSGAYGRQMAEYFLRPAHARDLRCVSLPHGYFIWTSTAVNLLEKSLWSSKRQKPDFQDRNFFLSYVVQNNEAKVFKTERGVSVERIKLLGSARYCPEWFEINKKLLSGSKLKRVDSKGCCVLIFIPDWNYNVDRAATTSLLHAVARMIGTELLIKANTRGTGALGIDERKSLGKFANVRFPDITEHSPVLIDQADVVINFASSIGIEAILQRKPVCNPSYLNGNSTIFDRSGVVVDTESEAATLEFISSVMAGKGFDQDDLARDVFLRRYVLGGAEGTDVLDDYIKLLTSPQHG